MKPAHRTVNLTRPVLTQPDVDQAQQLVEATKRAEASPPDPTESNAALVALDVVDAVVNAKTDTKPNLIDKALPSSQCVDVVEVVADPRGDGPNPQGLPQITHGSVTATLHLPQAPVEALSAPTEAEPAPPLVPAPVVPPEATVAPTPPDPIAAPEPPVAPVPVAPPEAPVAPAPAPEPTPPPAPAPEASAQSSCEGEV